MNHNMKFGLRKYLLLGLLAMLASVSLSAATVYFKNTSNWGNVYIYTWDSSCKTPDWPGVQMTNTGTDNIYSYETGCDNVGKVIFNCGKECQQTGDLSWDASKPLYVHNSGWQEYTPTSATTYYVTGNDAFHTALGLTGSWNPSAKPMTDGKVTFTAQANTEYQFKVTVGSWDTSWGYSVVNVDCSNVEYYADGTNVAVKTSETIEITIYFDGMNICLTREEADPYPINFGVVDNIGGEVTAVSEGSTVYSGTAVKSVTFTAQPAFGYVVEGWYSDEAGLLRIAESSVAYTLTRVTATNNTVYVKFKQARMVYLKPNDCNAWNDKYIYTFSGTPWDDSKGVHPQRNRMEYGRMQQVNDSVYAYALTNSREFAYVAFNSADQHGCDDFYQCEAIFRGDHKEALQMFVSEKGGATELKNNGSTTYRGSGVWMRYNATDAGYKLVLTNTATNATDRTCFTASAPGVFSFSLTESLAQGVSYTFYVENDNGDKFSRGADAGNSVTKETKGYRMYQWESASPAEVTFIPPITGEYTFNLHLSDGKVMIDVLFPATEYRLVYVERVGDAVKKFHPSHSVRQHTEATMEAPVLDTVSLHVRPYVKEAEVETSNPLDCEVWLQEYVTDGSTMQWNTVSTLNVKAMPQITGNGVYNFVLQQDGQTAVLLSEETKKYTGNYFIRSDASSAGWDYLSAKSRLQNRFWYSDYARQHENFDHYCCHWTTSGTNLGFVVANDYSYCLTDTLVQSAYEAANGFVTATGKLNTDANIRFMWNSYDNTTDRAFLAGAGNNLQLLSDNGIYDTGGTQRTDMQFADQQNWVYRLDVKADPNTRVKIKAPYAGVTQYFKGKEGDFSDANTFLFIEGTSGNSYNIRVIYDFKTNHLICAWIPDGEITSGETIQTDLMIIRENQGEARQLVFNPNDLSIGEVNNAYCVLTLTKEYLESSASSKEKTVYWVSFPFDVRLSEVFGCGTYGVDYAIQYYDGAARAENGCWSDSPTYWKHYLETNGVVLEKGKGYVVDIDWIKIKNEQFTHNNRDVSIYFPSANTDPMTISGTVETIQYPEHKCEIERDDRYIYDSNWNLMGVPSYANLDEFGNPMPARQIGKHKVGFLYEYDPATSSFTASEADKVKFLSMRSYLVQFAGEMDWENPVMQGVLPNQSIARKSVAEADNDGIHTVCLALKQAGNMLDRTYIRMQEDEATSAFDMNIDLAKHDKAGANLYSLTLGDSIRVAANVFPVGDNLTIPLGVVAAEDGTYTLTLPENSDGLEVVLVDSEDHTRTNLLLGDYVVNLTRGTYEKRFALEVSNRRVVTSTIGSTADHGEIRKYMIGGELFIRCGTDVYDALGRKCK